MNAIPVFVQAAMKLVPLLVSLGKDIAPLAQIVVDVVRGSGDPTDAQWAALHQLEDSLRQQLDGPPAAVVAPAAASAGVTVGG